MVPVRNLVDVGERLSAIPTLTPARLKLLMAALTTASRFLGCGLKSVPATPRELMPMLLALSTAKTGKSAKTLANNRALVKEALRLVGAGSHIRSDRTPLAPDWRALYDKLDTKRLRNGLSRFFHFASRSDIAPRAVDDQVLDRFVRGLDASGEVRDVRRRHMDTVLLWNASVDAIDGWPTHKFAAVPSTRTRKHRPWTELPAPLREDVDRYSTWLRGGKLFGGNAAPRAYSERTIQQRRELLRIATSILLDADVPADVLRSLDVLIEPENVKRILTRLWEEAGRRKTAWIGNMANELVFVAIKYRRSPREVIEELKSIRSEVAFNSIGLTDKNRHTLVQLDDQATLAKLIGLPSLLLKKSREPRWGNTRRTHFVQTAVAIEILLCAPIRLANLVGIELGKHLPFPKTTTSNADVFLRFAADEMKNRRPLTLPLSRQASVLIADYVRLHRPNIVALGENALFIGPDGMRAKADTIRESIIRAVRRHVGIEMTPHQFRHLAGHVLLKADPSAYVVVQQLLGHAHLKTTQNAYVAEQSVAAGRRLDAILTQKRESTGKSRA